MKLTPAKLSAFTICILLASPVVSISRSNTDDSGSMHNVDMQGSTTPALASIGASAPSPMSVATPLHSMPPSPISMQTGHHHGGSILDDPNLEPQQRAYWENYNTTNFLNETITNGKSAKGLLVSHIVLTFIAWFFLYPVSVTISGRENVSSVYLIIQTIQSIVALIALFCLALYAPMSPDLYRKNAYCTMSIILFFIIIIHWSSMIIKSLSTCALNSNIYGPIDGTEYMLANMNNHNNNDDRLYDSGHSSDGIRTPTNNTTTTTANFRPDIDANGYDMDIEEDELEALNNHSPPSPTMFEVRFQEKIFARLFKYPAAKKCVSKLEQTSSVIYTLINKPLFIYAFAYLLTGIAVFYRLGMANRVFSLLAHFIKGGVFFLFGIVTLGRYCGCFANHGMAWNFPPGSQFDHVSSLPTKRELDGDIYSSPPFHKQIMPRTNILSRFLKALVSVIPSMEFVECFLIFVYGITNVFLERLANPHGAWAHKDLQHVSIAFLYIGGGLCGLLVESPSVRKFLSGAINGKEDEKHSEIPSKARSLLTFNPIAAFTVFWTGVLMSQHQQELPLATKIHAQWGILLCVSAIFRIITYLMLYSVPPTSSKPTHPFTELIVSFCLICGGMVLIESNGETVEAMIYFGIDSMFSLNVNVGLALLIMSWVMVVLTIPNLVSSKIKYIK